MKEAVLVFIPCPGAGHLVSAVEFAKILADRDARLSIVFLLMKTPFDSSAAHIAKVTASTGDRRIRFVPLRHSEENLDVSHDPVTLIRVLIDNYKAHVKEAVAKLSQSRLAGFVIDLFCTAMIDVAKEFRVPTYVFFTCNAGFLSLMLHLQTLHDEHGKELIEFNDSEEELVLPGLANPLPAKMLPLSVIRDEGAVDNFLFCARRLRETQGILVNTFAELEPGVLNSLSADSKSPPVYPVGPVVNVHARDEHTGSESCDLMKWLDKQPPSSVVFLCFGSMGSLEEQQVKEIAWALKKSGYRFVWSLRRGPPKGKFELPGDYADPAEVLPEGFLDRTAGLGRVVGWAPQVAVLAHPAVGAFVSHCGWNSALESIWFGVPVAAWPLYAEQQFNAFCLLKEFDLAVEVKMDYRKELWSGVATMIIGAEEIEKKIRAVMELDAEKRNRVKEMSEKSRTALKKSGSSYLALGRVIQNMLEEMEKP